MLKVDNWAYGLDASPATQNALSSYECYCRKSCIDWCLLLSRRACEPTSFVPNCWRRCYCKAEEEEEESSQKGDSSMHGKWANAFSHFCLLACTRDSLTINSFKSPSFFNITAVKKGLRELFLNWPQMQGLFQIEWLIKNCMFLLNNALQSIYWGYLNSKQIINQLSVLRPIVL